MWVYSANTHHTHTYFILPDGISLFNLMYVRNRVFTYDAYINCINTRHIYVLYKLDSLAYELEFSMPYTADLFLCESESLMITEGRNLGVPIILFIDLFKGIKYFI